MTQQLQTIAGRVQGLTPAIYGWSICQLISTALTRLSSQFVTLPVGLDFNYMYAMSSVGYVKKYVSMLLYNATVPLSSQAGGSNCYVEPHFPTLWLTKQTRPQACICTKLLEVCLM